MSLGISSTTLKNWQRQNIIPQNIPDEIFEDQKKYDDFISHIKANAENKLSSRANRLASNEKSLNYLGITDVKRMSLLQELVHRAELVPCNAAILSLIICQLKTEKLLGANWPLILEETEISRKCQTWLTEISTETKINAGQIVSFFEDVSVPNENDDILGAFYQSLQSLGEKSGKGSFYTSKEILSGICVNENQTVYDPCCGSGNILLNVLSKNHNPSKIFASDIDETALKICETNLVLFFNNPDVKVNVFKNSLLTEQNKNQYDFIITNPPWGARFNTQEKKELKKKYSSLKTTESFSICLFNSYNLLSPEGELYFILPNSFLNVSAHKEIRKFLLNLKVNLSIKLLGSVFKGVFSQSLLLHVEKTSEKPWDHIRIENPHKTEKYTMKKINCTAPDYIIPAKVSSEEQQIIKKIFDFEHTTLKDNCIFGMGIVTGNNERFIKADDGNESGYEPIYRGKNIHHFKIAPTNEKVLFVPEQFQQIGQIELLRKRKIVYRFISNRPVCAISENGELFLNSANFFIPTLDYPWETIVMLFNSCIYAFIYERKYDSVKVLRNQLEELPLPLFTPEQHLVLKDFYNKIIHETDESKIFKLVKKVEEIIIGYMGFNVQNKNL